MQYESPSNIWYPLEAFITTLKPPKAVRKFNRIVSGCYPENRVVIYIRSHDSPSYLRVRPRRITKDNFHVKGVNTPTYLTDHHRYRYAYGRLVGLEYTADIKAT